MYKNSGSGAPLLLLLDDYAVFGEMRRTRAGKIVRHIAVFFAPGAFDSM